MRRLAARAAGSTSRGAFELTEISFRGELVFKAHRLVYHSTLGSRLIKKRKKNYAALIFLHALRGVCAWAVPAPGVFVGGREVVRGCEVPRPHAWSMGAACPLHRSSPPSCLPTGGLAAAADGGQHTFPGFTDVRVENGSSQGHNLTLTGMIVPGCSAGVHARPQVLDFGCAISGAWFRV